MVVRVVRLLTRAESTRTTEGIGYTVKVAAWTYSLLISAPRKGGFFVDKFNPSIG